MQLSAQMFLYAAKLREKALTHPSDDLATALVNVELDGRKLTPEEFNFFFLLLLIAGNETTRTVTTNGMISLLDHPDQLRALKDDITLLSDAVTEMVRYDSAVQMTPRQAREDIEVAGASIKAGETILCIVASANRDSTAWPDADRFDISRKSSYPLSFGGGPHYCLGAQLGQVETEVALQTIFERLPDLKPEIDDPRWLPGTVVFRGLQSLPATA